MKRGPKKMLPAEKEMRGTYRAHRDADIQIIESDGMPQMPDWLTPEGEEVWQDNVGRVSQKLVSEADSNEFANFCVLQGGIVKAVRAGEMPPVAAFAEVRKKAEMFGIAGPRSRMVAGAPKAPASNPFAKVGRRGS